MTIKHLGGIFGRNPTFNDVTIDGGIYFEDGQSGNYLDDYEEGTWTGVLNNYGGAGSVTEERYTKIGRTVVASCDITLDGTADGSGFVIGGLPFTASGGSGDSYGSIINYNTGNEPTAKGFVQGGTTEIKIVTTAKTAITYTAFQNGSACELSLTAIYVA